MCECKNKQQADAWASVAAALSAGNPQFWSGASTGLESAVREIERLYDAEKRRTGEAEAWKAAHARVLGERNDMIDQRDAARRDRDAIGRAHDEELKRHAETLRRERRDRFAREPANPVPPVMGGGVEAHKQNVRQAVLKYARNDSKLFSNHPRSIAEAVYYLLQRVEKLETQLGGGANSQITAPSSSWEPPPPGQW